MWRFSLSRRAGRFGALPREERAPHRVNAMEKTASFKKFIFALLFGLAGAFAGAYSVLLLPLAAAVTVYSGVRWGRIYAAVPFIFTLVAIFFSRLGDDFALYSLCCAFTVFTLFTYTAFTLRLPYRLTALVLAAAALLALYAALALPSVLAGKAPYDGVIESLRTMDAYYRSAGYVIEDIAELRDSIPNLFYGMLILAAEAASFATVTLSYKFLKSTGAVRPMARFREWQLPQSLKLGLPVFAAAVAIMYAAGSAAAPVLLYTLLYALLPLLAAGGIATALYLALRGRDRFSLPIALLVAFMTVMSPYFMAILGTVDLYAGIRRRMIRTDRLIREAFEKANRDKSSTVTVDFGDGNGPQIIARRRDDAFFDHVLKDEEGENAADSSGEKAEDAEKTDNGDNGDNNENSDTNEPDGAAEGTTKTNENSTGGED